MEKTASGVEVLVGCNSHEEASFIPLIPKMQKLISIPILGNLLSSVLIKWLTGKIYRSGGKEFSERHSARGGWGFKYVFTWGAPKNQFAGGHTTEIPLLFEDRDVWEHSPLLEGTAWEEFKRQGQQLRKIWEKFARTGQVHDTDVQGLIKIESI